MDCVPGWPEPGQSAGVVGSFEPAVPGPDALGSGDEDAADLVQGCGAGLHRGAGGVVQGAYAGDGVVLGGTGGPS